MRTTLSLDDDVYDMARQFADATGRSLGSAISELVRAGLRPRAPSRDDAGLPVFAVPRDAPMIPGDLAAKLLADDLP